MSGDTDTILKLQGIGYLKRLAIRNATVTLDIKHYKDEAGVEKIDINQVLRPSFRNPSPMACSSRQDSNRRYSWNQRREDVVVDGASHQRQPFRLCDRQVEVGSILLAAYRVFNFLQGAARSRNSTKNS
jgi:hypothetical protein